MPDRPPVGTKGIGRTGPRQPSRFWQQLVRRITRPSEPPDPYAMIEGRVRLGGIRPEPTIPRPPPPPPMRPKHYDKPVRMRGDCGHAP